MIVYCKIFLHLLLISYVFNFPVHLEKSTNNILGKKTILNNDVKLFENYDEKELAIVYKYTTAYDLIWRDKGSGGRYDLTIWRPKNYQSEFCLLGDVAVNYYHTPFQPAVVVEAKKSGAMVHPTSFSRVWKDSGSGAYMNCALYKMNAPAGYTCLGGVAMRSHTAQPDKYKYCCVKDDYVVEGSNEWVYNDKGTGSRADLTLWTVVKGTNAFGLGGGNFIPVNGYYRPSNGYLLKGDQSNVKNAWSLANDVKPLQLFEVSDLKEIWNDKGSVVSGDIAIWRTETKENYFSVGDIAVDSYSKPSIGFLLKVTNPNDYNAIAYPVSYSLIWDDGGSIFKHDVFIWRVNCPSGYVALGNVATTNDIQPEIGSIVCVKSEYAEIGNGGEDGWRLIWKDIGSGAKRDVSIYETKGAKQSLQTVRGFGAVANYNNYPTIPPYLLKKSAHSYLNEKPIKKIIMSHVNFDLNAEQRLPAKPISIKTLTLTNNGLLTQTSTKTVNYTKSETSLFTFAQGIELGVQLEITAGLPMVGSGKTTISSKLVSTFTTGTTKTATVSEAVLVHVDVPANSKITAIVTANEYTSDVPFTATIKKIYYDGSEGSADITGIYHGVSVSETHVVYSKSEPI